jgi:RHS repeat-associated protein
VANDFGQPLEQTGPSFTERWNYDANGNLIEHQDRDGFVYRAVYGSWNALRQDIDALGFITAFEQNVQGLVSKVTDPGGTVTEYRYDLKETLVEVHRHDRLRERYILDKAGNIISKKDAHGNTLVTWEVGAGNLDKVRILASGETHAFDYDERGRVTAATTPAGKITFAYDEDTKILADQRDGLGVVHEFDFGQLISTTYFDKFKVAYETDDDGQLTVIDPLGGKHRVLRSENGLIAKYFANGSRELSQFDAQGRCLRKAIVRSSSAAPWMRNHAYSSAGDLLSTNDTQRGRTRYSYDASHRLTQEITPDGALRRFAYDAAGNLLAQPGLENVVMDKGNRLAEANGDRFTYNHRDHITQRIGPRGTIHYEYNDLDMLVGCKINGAAWTATYDAYCRRVSKTWQGQTTIYYWDDFRLAAEIRYDGLLRIYVYVDEIALVPFLFVEYANADLVPESGQRYYVLTSQLGVPIRVDDAQGKVCWTANIDPYGRAEIAEGSTLEMPLRFPGHYLDSETGLHYNRFRYFSPELGRYLQSDPLGLEGGINLYAYPGNPLTTVDLDGLKTPAKAAKPSKKGAAAEKAAQAKAACAARKAEAARLKAKEEAETKKKLQEKVDQAVKDLKENPALAKDLMSAGSYQHLKNGKDDPLYAASFGKAVERHTAVLVAQDPALAGQVAHTGQSRGPNGQFISSPDFTPAKEGAKTYDVTTQKDVAKHEQRPGYENTDYLTYERPDDVKFK